MKKVTTTFTCVRCGSAVPSKEYMSVHYKTYYENAIMADYNFDLCLKCCAILEKYHPFDKKMRKP